MFVPNSAVIHWDKYGMFQPGVPHLMLFPTGPFARIQGQLTIAEVAILHQTRTVDNAENCAFGLNVELV